MSHLIILISFFSCCLSMNDDDSTCFELGTLREFLARSKSSSYNRACILISRC